jgi:hypothetical protein
MHHKGQETPFRKVVWVERPNVGGWGCSECAWVFSPAGQFIDESLEEMEWRFRRQLIEGFASHNCAEHPRDIGHSAIGA